MKRSKRYIEAAKLVDSKKIYDLNEAITLVKKTSTVKFDASIDIAIKLNLNTTKADQQLRGNLSLPHHFGKQQKILVLADDFTAADAKACGADYFGGTDKIADIKNGWLDFDLIITNPKMMPNLAKLGKILGPKGLMPNPKLGTVTTNIVDTVKDFKKGKSTYHTDSYGNIHMKIGKVSAKEEQMLENINFLMDFLKSKRPSTVKGDYVQNISVSTAMGPAIKVARF